MTNRGFIQITPISTNLTYYNIQVMEILVKLALHKKLMKVDYFERSIKT